MNKKKRMIYAIVVVLGLFSGISGLIWLNLAYPEIGIILFFGILIGCAIYFTYELFGMIF